MHNHVHRDMKNYFHNLLYQEEQVHVCFLSLKFVIRPSLGQLVFWWLGVCSDFLNTFKDIELFDTLHDCIVNKIKI